MLWWRKTPTDTQLIYTVLRFFCVLSSVRISVIAPPRDKPKEGGSQGGGASKLNPVGQSVSFACHHPTGMYRVCMIGTNGRAGHRISGSGEEEGAL